MGYDYDKLYGETPDALGAPTQVFVDFFEGLEVKGLRVLDVGCGQGRDALYIARLSHHVTGVDLSPNGIRDLNASAAHEGLDINGVVADITTFKPDGMFDVILIDRTLHMLEELPRLEVLARLLDHVLVGGWVLIADEKSNIAGFDRVVAAHSATWRMEFRNKGYWFLQRG